MPLQKQLKDTFDDLYDKLVNREDGSIEFERITIGNQQFKIKIIKGSSLGISPELKYQIEIWQRD